MGDQIHNKLKESRLKMVF